MLIFCATVGWGQNFTYPSNAEYGVIVDNNVHQFLQYKVADNDHFSTAAIEDPRIIITADKVAANGYGQWTVSTAFGTNVEPQSTQTWICSPDQADVNGGN